MSIIFFVSDPCSKLGRYEHMFTQMLKRHNETYSMVDILVRKGHAIRSLRYMCGIHE